MDEKAGSACFPTWVFYKALPSAGRRARNRRNRRGRKDLSKLGQRNRQSEW